MKANASYKCNNKKGIKLPSYASIVNIFKILEIFTYKLKVKIAFASTYIQF